MENNGLFDDLIGRLDKIYLSFNTVFDINFQEFNNVFKRIINDISKVEFYKKMFEEGKLSISFDEESLLKVKNFLLSFNLDEDTIKKIILSSPQILLYSGLLENIFLIYKNNNFKGFVLVDEENYKSYSVSNSSDSFNYLSTILDKYDVNSYDYLVEEMLATLDREDIRQNLGIIINDGTKLVEKMKALSKGYSKKNYYFKKSR